MSKATRTLAVALLLLVSGIGTAAVSAQTTADQSMTRDADDDGFDQWGLLGLLGLAGLLGRKRDDRHKDTHRV